MPQIFTNAGVGNGYVFRGCSHGYIALFDTTGTEKVHFLSANPQSTGVQVPHFRFDTTGNMFIDGQTGVGDTYLGFDSGLNVQMGGKVTRLNSITMNGGFGVPGLVTEGRLTAITAASTSITSFGIGTAATGVVDITGWVKVTAFTSGTIGIQATWTDETNAAQTTNLPLWTGSAIASTLGATGIGLVVKSRLWCKSNTTVGINLVISATATADAEASAELLV